MAPCLEPTLKLRGVVSYEPSELVVTVRAGTPLAELEAVLAEHGQCLAFEPPCFSLAPDLPSSSTCGGMVASGLAGPARASVGGVRDYVLGVQMVNGRGEHLTFGGQVIKNVAGYDVSRLMVGAMGTLGVLTDISLKVLPVGPAEATLVFELNQADALEQLHRWGAQPLPLNASCWVHGTGTGTGTGTTGTGTGPNCCLCACVAPWQRWRPRATDACELPGTRMDNAQARPDWALCRDQRLPFFMEPPAPDCALWRLSVPQTAPVLEVPWPQLVEWHGACAGCGRPWMLPPRCTSWPKGMAEALLFL
jgi:glycolate oxidase FAD binding subunit